MLCIFIDGGHQPQREVKTTSVDHAAAKLIGTVMAQSTVPIRIRDRKPCLSRDLRDRQKSKRRGGDSLND
jgi:hypothetical protein